MRSQHFVLAVTSLSEYLVGGPRVRYANPPAVNLGGGRVLVWLGWRLRRHKKSQGSAVSNIAKQLGKRNLAALAFTAG